MLGITPGSCRTAKRLPDFMAHELGRLPAPRVEDVFGGLPRFGSREAKALGHEPGVHSPLMLRRMKRVPEGGRWKGGQDHFAQAYGRLHRKGLARTITTFFSNPGSGRYWHPTDDRVITLREAARLQGFDDGFRFESPHLSYNARLIGNALDAYLADASYRAVRRCLD
jgi:DNA (cytosine-5)-methyltransferase 1